MTLSAIIPTRDRPDLLADCLETLAAQEGAPDGFEVVVIDDGSAADLAAVVDRFAGSAVRFRYERQQPGGLNVARNTGAAAARGDVLAYLDDDTLVDRRWAAAVVEGFETLGCDAIAGRLVLQLEGPEPPWLAPGLRRYLSELDLGERPRSLHGGEWPFGANCAVRRRAFDAVGGFRPGLDRAGASLVSNGDTEFFERVRASGATIGWWPDATVRHRVPAERLTTTWFRKRAYAQGISDALLDRGASGRQWGRVPREVVRALRAGPILVRGAVTRHGSVPARLWVRYCAGRIAGFSAPRGLDR